VPSQNQPPTGPGPRGVHLRPEPANGPDSRWNELAEQAGQVDGNVDAAIVLARRVGKSAPPPGGGNTAERWEQLATLAAVDLTAARVAEAHLDALAILGEADVRAEQCLSVMGAGPESTWGVFAAEGPGVRLQARAPSSNQDTWSLEGTKPWCSLAGTLSHALVTAHTSAGHRRLFAVALRDPAVEIVRGTWVSRGLSAVDSGPIILDGVRAQPVGADEWYLDRSGFAWGGAGVAACWYGGAVGLARSLWQSLGAREPDQIAQMHLGAVDLALRGCRAVLFSAAQAIDSGRAGGSRGAILAGRVRGVVAAAAEEVLTRVGHVLGPAPMTQDEVHARRVADLTIYLRQHHGERDDAALGRALLDGDRPW
jgi:alkylation response protein AidB-like acyl-CoA dehydrogenase